MAFPSRLACVSIVLVGALTVRADDDPMPSGDDDLASSDNGDEVKFEDDENDGDDDGDEAAPSDDDAPFLIPPDLEAPIPPDLNASLNDVVPRTPRLFRDVSYGLPAVEFQTIAASPVDDDIIFVGADGFLFKTDDGGESWRPVLTFPRGLNDDVFLRELREERLQADPLEANQLPGRDPSTSDVTPLGDEGLSEDEFDDTDDRSASEVDDDFDDTGRRESQTESSANLSGDDDSLMPEGDVDLITLQGLLPPERPGVRTVRIAPDGEIVYVATARGLFKSKNAGETFTSIELPGGSGTKDVRDVGIDPDDARRVFVGTRVGVFMTTDGGQSFIPLLTPRRSSILALSVERVDGSLVVHVGDTVGVLRSWDGGRTFLPLLLQGVSAFEPVSVVVFDARNGNFYAGTQSGLFVGERKAAILERRFDVNGLSVVAISVDPLRQRGVALGIEGQGLLVSDDTGLTFVELGDSLPATNASGLARGTKDTDGILVSTERGVFRFQEGTGILVAGDRVRILEQTWRVEPTLSETVEAALTYHRIHPAAFRPLAWRARMGAFAPRVQLQYRMNWGRRYLDEDQYVLFEDEPEDFDEDEAKDLVELYDLGLADFAPQAGFYHSLFVTFRWQMDRMIYNPAEPAVARMRPLRVAQERRIADRIHTLYVARRRLLAELALEGQPSAPAAYAAKAMRLEELETLLDGQTGGAFSALAKARGAQLDPLDPFQARAPTMDPRRTAHNFGNIVLSPPGQQEGADAPRRSP